MFQQTDRPSPPSPLRLGALVLHLLFTHFCRGQSQMIGPPHPIMARVGDDIILPCHLEPAVDVSAEILEWKRHDLSKRFVFVLRSGQDLKIVKNPSYKGRTSVFMDELKNGNISLKLSKVQISDQGTYECDLPLKEKRSSVKLVVVPDAVSSPNISLSATDRNSGVVLNCESKGWYPELEVLWLDGEGNLLSAGPAETVRGPDDLYTVSSRVTVEKRHSNRFTCRVQQKDINQTREAHIHIPDEFFEVQSCSSSSSVTGLAVILAVCILIILLLVFFVWRQNKNKTRRHQDDEVRHKESRAEQKELLEEKREAQREVDPQRKLLESKNTEVDGLNSEVKKLTEEKWKSESERQKLQTDLEMKTNQVYRLIDELKDEKKKSQNLQKELNTKEKEVGGLTVYVQKLEKDLETKKKELDNSEVKQEPQSVELQKKSGELADLHKEPHKERQHEGSSSDDRPVIEVDDLGQYIRLRNSSDQDQQLGGWMLKLQVNNKEPVSFTFDPSFILKARKFVKLWCQSYGYHDPPTHLVWRDLKTWSTEDHLQIFLYSNSGEIKSEFTFTGR